MCDKVVDLSGYGGLFEVTYSDGDYFDFENLQGSNFEDRGMSLDTSATKNEINVTNMDFATIGDAWFKHKCRVGVLTIDSCTCK